MVIETLPEELRTRSAEPDWRDGLHVYPAGHVFGKTALTQQEWRQRAHDCDRQGLRFVLVASKPGSNFVSTARFWAAAHCDLAHLIELAPAALGGEKHVRVLELSEWDRIQREGRR